MRRETGESRRSRSGNRPVPKLPVWYRRTGRRPCVMSVGPISKGRGAQPQTKGRRAGVVPILRPGEFVGRLAGTVSCGAAFAPVGNRCPGPRPADGIRAARRISHALGLPRVPDATGSS